MAPASPIYPDSYHMALKTLEYLRGISPEDCRRLRAKGIWHSNQLLHATTLEIDRQHLSARTRTRGARLHEFGRQCATLEIAWMEPLLRMFCRLGITGLKQLKRTEPEELHGKILEA